MQVKGVSFRLTCSTVSSELTPRFTIAEGQGMKEDDKGEELASVTKQGSCCDENGDFCFSGI
jgi:hypothetical protein